MEDMFGLKTTVTIFFGLISKQAAIVFSGLASKPVTRVFRFVPQNRRFRFDDLCLKFITTVCWFGPQN
jgi:hypothetical protein